MVNKKYWYYILFLIVPCVIVFLFIQKEKNILKNYKCNDCNVVLISVDTLRQDHVSSYGYKRKTTVNIDRFFNSAIYFKNATSASSWTLPATMSIFTGLLPSNHNVTNKFFVNDKIKDLEISKLKDSTQTLAQILKNNGYKTGGFTGGAGVDKQFGFDKGFDVYYDKNNFGGFSDSSKESLKWINENKNNKIFVFLHGYDVHGQYSVDYDKRFVNNYHGNLNGSIEEQKSLREEGLINNKISLSKDDVDFLISLYDEKIQRMDKNLNTFFEEYTKITNNKKTIFILTSDHGEEFYEHGQIDHGHSLYNELINVPLIIKLPQINNKITIRNRVTTIDILPTILNLLKIDETKSYDGKNMFSFKNNNRKIISESEYRFVVSLKSTKLNNNWKLIENLKENKKEFYNVLFDKKEKKNIYNQILKINKKPIDFFN